MLVSGLGRMLDLSSQISMGRRKHWILKKFLRYILRLAYDYTMKNTFDFAKNRLLKQAENQGVEISRFYMICDHPLADIKGGNDNGCETILVRTGVLSGKNKFFVIEKWASTNDNDLKNPAKYVA